jgi:ABC-2 type transport system permease protein
MRTILFLVQKEFLQIFRNKTMLPIIFIMPIIQLLVLANAATMEMKSIKMAIVDCDKSVQSRELISHFEGSPFYNLTHSELSVDKTMELIKNGSVDAIFVIPHNFAQSLAIGQKTDVQLLINAINASTAGLTNAYTSAIVSQYSSSLGMQVSDMSNLSSLQIRIIPRYWYNPQLNYSHFMVPGILVILVTIIGMFLTAINLVREKEIGTIEQINVTPIKKYEFIIGKLIPFWVIGLVELGFGLTIGKIFFDIPIEGSLFTLFGFAAIYLVVALCIGLYISILASSQQQVMFMAFFFAIVFILMSGIFTPTESMPQWAQYFNKFNPLYYFMRVIRMILVKGAHFKEIAGEFVAISVLAIATLTLAIGRLRKTV